MSNAVRAAFQSVTSMTLPHLPIEQSDFAVDPMPYLEAARRQHPWLAKCSVGYVIHGYQATKDLMWMDDKLRTSNDSVTEIMGAKDTNWGRFIDNQILALSGAEHARVRSSVAQAFTPRNINRHRSTMRDVVARLLDEWAPKKKFDYAEFASYFPIIITCAVVGASPDAISPLRKAMETLGVQFSLDPSLLPAFEESYNLIEDFVDKLVREREENSGGEEEDTLNSLIASRNAGVINDQELRSLLVFIFLAGYDTSKNILTLIMHAMLQHPEMWERCAVDRAYCGKVVEEIFRFSTVASPYRTVAEDFEYDGVKLTKGTLLVFALPLAGRDPSTFSDPMEFRPERDHANRHIAFGRGAHMCLGQHLAKIQIEEGIHVIAQRITKPKLAGEVTWRPFTGVWGIRTLPIEFVPAPAQVHEVSPAHS
ncbi:MAG: cytochrome P450 [Rhodospirillaceae bacterium]|nr:MAG: cytochrome P450 [Rhodospirillaceae bacterium]